MGLLILIGNNLLMFSSNILWLEIRGLDKDYLSIINIPRIFKTITLGLITKIDITLIRDMVLSYIRNP
jgi:hypothetical protein